MSSYDYDLIVLGGGAAGLTVAAGAAQLGVKTLIVDREHSLGGDCLHFGCVPSKALIHTAKVWHTAGQTARYGLPVLELPPVNFSQVTARIKSVIDTIQPHDSEERFCGLGAKVIFGQASFTDPHTIQIDDQTCTGKTIVIATGSSAAAPPIPGLAETPHLTNREIFGLDTLPQKLVVLGGGPIAVEMAQSFARLGSKVTIIQRSSQILSKEDTDMAQVVEDALRADGVEIILESAIESIRQVPDGVEVCLLKGEQKTPQVVTGSHLLQALGRAPNIAELDLDKAGVKHTRRGIEVNTRMRTNVPHIYAAGDVTGTHQFTHAAGYEGGIVLSNAVFHLPRSAKYTLLPWATYSDPELASIGMNEKAAQQAGQKYSVWTEEFSDNDRAIAEGETKGRIKLLLDPKGKPLGAQIVGPHAGELINEWVAIMNANMKLSGLASAVHPYPTLGEINKRVAGKLLSGKLFSPTVQKGLKLLFGFKGRACYLEDEENDS